MPFIQDELIHLDLAFEVVNLGFCLGFYIPIERGAAMYISTAKACQKPFGLFDLNLKSFVAKGVHLSLRCDYYLPGHGDAATRFKGKG
jgi:hypothetical protein